MVQNTQVRTQTPPRNPESVERPEHQPPVTFNQAEATKVILVSSQWAEV